MPDEELSEWYFDWILNIVYDNAPIHNICYNRLIRHLHTVPFRYILARDSNRADDGISLRHTFAYNNGLDEYQAASIYHNKPCSVLEMMVALAIRCEEEMLDPFMGDQTSKWFWGMIQSLGLLHMTDRAYNENFVENVITRFLDREYAPNGHGGLFTIENCTEDLRDVEIWYQLNWYLCSL